MAQKGISFKITAVNKTKQAFRGITSGLKKVSGAVFNLKTALTGVVGVAGMGLLIKNSLTATDRLGKMSNVLGITVKDLQTLRLASEIGGIEFETFAKATRRLTDNFGDFLNGTGEATATFKALGISQSDAIALSGDQIGILSLVADRLDEVENSTLKLKFAQEIFGGRGAELINVLKGGSEELRKFAIESDRFGSLTSSQVSAVENFNDSIVRMKTVFANIVNTIVADLSPAFFKLSEDLRDFALNQVGDIQNFGKGFAMAMLDATESLLLFGENVKIAGGNLRIFFKNTADLLDFSKILDNIKSGKKFEPFKEFTNEISPELSKVLLLIRKRILEVADSTDNLSDGLKKAKNEIEDTEKELKFLEDRLTRLEGASDSFGNTISKSFESAVLSGERLSETLRKLGTSLVQMIYNETVTKPLAEKISSVIRNVLGTAIDKTKEIKDKNKDITNAIFESNGQRAVANSLETTNNALLTQKLITERQITAEKDAQNKEANTKMKYDIIGMFTGGSGGMPFMAKGGTVSGGKSYVVGEEGAEIFTPSSNGSIIPNDKIGSSNSIKIVQEINIMPSVSEVARAEIFGMLPLIKQEALNGVLDARNRGGSFARSMGVKA